MRDASLLAMKICLMVPGALALAAIFGCLAPPATSADIQKPSPRVLVLFDHPEKFLDIRDRYYATEQEKGEILAMFREYITQRAPVYLPEGDALYVNFVNIKLAGVFRIGGIGEHRVVSASTPPMFMFGWAITDRSGKVVRRAWKKLEEDNFKDLSSRADEGDPYRFEKAVLDDWMRSNLQI